MRQRLEDNVATFQAVAVLTQDSEGKRMGRVVSEGESAFE
jgi:hypothetical protein